MNKCVFSLILSGLAIIIASVPIFSNGLNLDSCDFILGVLTILVTVLVGWQIYTVIDIKKGIHDEISKELNKQIQSARDTALFVSMAQQGKVSYNNNDLPNAIASLFNALCIWREDLNLPLAKESYNYCIVTLSEIVAKLSNSNGVFVLESIEERDAFIRAALKTKQRKIIDFATQIKINDSEK